MSINSSEKPCSRCGHIVDIKSEFCPCCGHIFSVASRYKQIEEDDIMFEKERNLIEETKRKFYNSYDEPSLWRRNEKVKGKIYDEPSLYRRETFKPKGSMGSDFNLFEILGGYDNINKIVSRFLRELLSPDGTHGMGAFFLKPFVYDVLNLDIPKFELEKAKVFLVEHKHNDTWIPKIHIRINWRLVILLLEINDTEGIFLSEQGEQRDADFVYLLTPHSFKYDVMNWLSYCIRQLDVNDGMIYQALSQFSDMIKNFLLKNTDDHNSSNGEDITDLILSSQGNAEAALNIHDAVHGIGHYLKNRVLAAIRVEVLKVMRLCNFRDYAKIGNDGYLYVRSDIRSGWQKCSLCNDDFPNFKFPNEDLMGLCDKLTFDVFVSRCVKKILGEF